MSPECWEQIKELFHASLEHEPAERPAFLARACADDGPLRREVESLLASHEQAESFIETPASDVAAALLAEDQPGLVAGQVLGHFRVADVLAKGGMGEVYLVDDTRLQRKVALKLLPPQFTVNADRVRRFEQEARAASALNHPNIVTIHEIGQTDSLHFIATEFVDGETLREHMANTRMTVSEVLDVAVQVASALSAAHEAGIVHRDIKPENVMLRRDRIVKVLDFGLAKLAPQQVAAVGMEGLPESRVKTNPGVVMGTVGYMSPEQARGTEVDMRTDIWSLGVVLYEMVSGRAPFEGETPSHVIVSILESEPPPLAHDAEVPAELEWIVAKALRKERAERYQTAGNLALDLKSLKQELEVEPWLKQFRRPDASGRETAAKSDGYVALNTAHAPVTSTADVARARPTSSAEYLVNRIKRHRGSAIFASATALLLIASLVYFSNFTKGGGGAIDSVAVLPFVNESGDPDTEYLSDGISESLINSLSQLPGVKVIARSSSFKYKGREVDVQEVARALGVEAVLTGRVTQRGEKLLISVELVDARDRTQVWGEQFNREARDVLAVQSDISREIAESLRLRLSAGERQQLAKRETVNPQAYELLLKGRFFWNKGATGEAKKAIEYFNQAVAVDPNYALAYAELSLTYNSLVNANVLDPREFTPKAEATADKALELDESLAEAHLAVAVIKSYAWGWAAAEREFKRAIELNPNLASAHGGYTHYLIIRGRYDEAIAEAKRARELDPLSTGANAVVVYGLLLARQYDQAIEAAKKMLELDQSNPNVHALLGQTYTRKGLHLEAIAAWQEAIRLGDDSPDAQIFLGAAYARAGEPEPARAILKRLETGKEYVSPAGLAMLRVALGEREEAFALLERAYAAHDQQLIWLGIEPGFDPLRSDPRFQELLRRIGLAQ